eukprot:scaffold427625_cov31-Prasinocladus_malaysianus.AAC.1
MRLVPMITADKEIAQWMRANMKSKVVVTANKCERKTYTGEKLLLSAALLSGQQRPTRHKSTR